MDKNYGKVEVKSSIRPYAVAEDEIRALQATHKEVLSQLGELAYRKSTRALFKKYDSLEVETIFTLHIFSDKEFEDIRKRMAELEAENRHLQFELNRRQAGHFDNI